jgi:hypothetical protein
MLSKLTTLLGSRELAIKALNVVAEGPSEQVLENLDDCYYWGNPAGCMGDARDTFYEIMRLELKL